jgi:uncharacterized ferritin-like protein (DUF455 family)
VLGETYRDQAAEVRDDELAATDAAARAITTKSAMRPSRPARPAKPALTTPGSFPRPSTIPAPAGDDLPF